MRVLPLLVSKQRARDRVSRAELPHSPKQGGMKARVNIACVCVRALAENRAGSLELPTGEESFSC